MKQKIRLVFRLTLVGVVWGMLLYSVLLGGFSTSLADYQNLTCQDIGCKNLLYCGGPGTPVGCKIHCQSGAVIDCPQ
jgi:hypothetical protein